MPIVMIEWLLPLRLGLRHWSPRCGQWGPYPSEAYDEVGRVRHLQMRSNSSSKEHMLSAHVAMQTVLGRSHAHMSQSPRWACICSVPHHSLWSLTAGLLGNVSKKTFLNSFKSLATLSHRLSPYSVHEPLKLNHVKKHVMISANGLVRYVGTRKIPKLRLALSLITLQSAMCTGIKGRSRHSGEALGCQRSGWVP